MRKEPFEVHVDQRFEEVVRKCAEPRVDSEETWISEEIIEAYVKLHELGFAHSVECISDGELVGGVYGVSLGAAFFGESMFHRRTDASKVALYHLVEGLKERGFSLLDVQYMTDHLRSLGAVEIPKEDYESRLCKAVQQEVQW